ncbi:MAG TPA: hypothetical protein VHH73_10340, partial [Verrucomicrobiae bacterium]|nr:hypothetical protein [Verrucomicrobiae bacterium]
FWRARRPENQTIFHAFTVVIGTIESKRHTGFVARQAACCRHSPNKFERVRSGIQRVGDPPQPNNPCALSGASLPLSATIRFLLAK